MRPSQEEIVLLKFPRKFESVITSEELTRPRDETEQGHSNENLVVVIITEENHGNLSITHNGSGILYSLVFNEILFWELVTNSQENTLQEGGCVR
jgi:hypothetical protein